MLIYVFAEFYPTSYKPYFDTQFADFVAKGHELVIFSAGQLGTRFSHKVDAFRLRERVRFYPTSLRTLPRFAPRLVSRLVSRPLQSGRIFRRATARSRKVQIMDTARALSLPRRPPDFGLLHNLITGVQLKLLREIYPEVPLALYYHGGEVPKWTKPLDSGDVRRTFDMFDVVFTNTQFSKKQVIDRGCNPEKVVILPVGFDIAEFQPDERRVYRPDGCLRLVSASRLSEEKGVQHAITALGMLEKSELAHIKYTVVGDGYMRSELENLVRELGLTEVVRFVGERYPEETVREFGNADALLLPSLPLNGVENQACVVQEALLMKALVATSRVGGVPESIPESMKQFSFDCGDSNALRDVIRRLLSMTPEAYEDLGARGREWVAGRYDIRAINQSMIETAMASRITRLPAARRNKS